MTEHYTPAYVLNLINRLERVRDLVTGQKHCTLASCGCSASKLSKEIREIVE